MKSVLLSVLMGIGVCTGAWASDGGVYVETTENYTEYVEFSYDAPAVPVRRPVAYVARGDDASSCGAARVRSSMDVRPCAVRSVEYGAPVRVKTHSEVIDHYQMYQPVTQYVPAGTYTTRRIVRAAPCVQCGE